MKRLSVSLTAKSPFSISASRAGGNVQKTLDFVTGTSIRGVFAKLWIESKGLDDDFMDIFTSGKVSFSNFYIKGANYIKGAKPIPMSAYACKYYSGFLGDKDRHGAVDILLPLTREKVSQKKVPDKIQRCQFLEDSVPCRAPMKKLRGYYVVNLSDNSLNTITVDRRLVYRTAISHVSETALENALYSLEVVEKGQTFKGEIFFSEDSLFNAFTSFIKGHESILIGADKSSGLGRFDILSIAETEGAQEDGIRSRIEEFNRKLDIKNGKTYFSITLQSDAIITDKYMRHKSFLEAEDINVSHAESVLGLAEMRTVQGWNALTRLPREDVWAIEKGSLFVFEVDDIDSAMESLLKLEASGIGRRRGEGFGRVSVCDSFHLAEDMK